MKTKTGFTKEYLLSKLIEASELLGHSPSQRDIENRPEFPSRMAYRNHFGTFAKAMEQAGLPMIRLGGLCPNHPKNPQHPEYKVRIKRKKEHLRPYLKIRFRVFKRDDFTCQYCGRTPKDGAKLQVDHINPRSNGGNDEFDNLITACFECNTGKSDYLLDSHSLKTKNLKRNI